jgi:hypothetical protein
VSGELHLALLGGAVRQAGALELKRNACDDEVLAIIPPDWRIVEQGLHSLSKPSCDTIVLARALGSRDCF